MQASGGPPQHRSWPLTCLQVSDRLMKINADAFLTMKLAAGWLAMRLDIFGLVVLTGTGGGRGGAAR